MPDTTLKDPLGRTIVLHDRTWRGHVVRGHPEMEPLRALAEERGWKAGDLFMAIRVAITGRTVTPPLFDTMVAIGYDRTLDRLRAAIDLLDRERHEETEHAAVT